MEYRGKLGFDSSLASAVLVHTGSEDSANYSYLWDLDPGTTTSDWGLGVGQSYTDANAAVTLTTLSADGTGAWVQVTFGPVPCAGANPSVALSPSGTQYISPGAATSYAVSVTNNDSANCGPSTFTLGATVPTGWTAAFAPASLTLSPGASGSTTLTVTAPSSATAGSYAIPVTTANSTDPTSYASTSVTAALFTSLNVTVKTDKSTYPTSTPSILFTASVSGGGSSVAGASVTFTITKPDGSTLTLPPPGDHGDHQWSWLGVLQMDGQEQGGGRHLHGRGRRHRARGLWKQPQLEL